MMKKLMNLDHLAYYCRFVSFLSVDNLNVGARPNFDLINTIYKFSSKIL